MNNVIMKKRNGFSILAVILVIVGVIVAIGIWALSGQTNIGNSNDNNLDVQATNIITNATMIKSEYDRLVLSGVTPSTIVFKPNVVSTTVAPNILDTVNGLQNPKISTAILRSSSALGTTEGFFVYNSTGFKGNNIGTSAADTVIALGGLKDNVCKRINVILNGQSVEPGVGASLSGATAANPTATAPMDLNSYPALAGWTSGCITIGSGATDWGMYFLILKAN